MNSTYRHVYVIKQTDRWTDGKDGGRPIGRQTDTMAESEVNVDKRPQFGGRFLRDPSQVFQHNAWDNVRWDEEQEAEAKIKVANNTKTKLSDEEQKKYEEDAARFWDEFYMQHQNRFFKDRHWLFVEFPELAADDILASRCDKTEAKKDHSGQSTKDGLPTGEAEVARSSDDTDPSGEGYPGSSALFRIFEVGCGVGNTVFPVLRTNRNPNLFVYGCDLSSQAVEILKEQPDYDPSRCHVFVCDVTNPESKLPFPQQSLDIIVLIFILSAISPAKFQFTIDRLASYLKPGGYILFRDYGRYDLAQLRFKDGQCLGDNFYVRGDGTRVFFFTQDELRDLFTKAGLDEVQNIVDRRLQVNRGRQLMMHRVWIQCKYRKPEIR